MNPPRTPETLANALASAWREQRTVGAQDWQQTLTDADSAYRTQDLVAEAMGWFDAEGPRHWKSGGPSREAALTHAPLPPVCARVPRTCATCTCT
jgi:2-keto-4-pentenoate hydratase